MTGPAVFVMLAWKQERTLSSKNAMKNESIQRETLRTWEVLSNQREVRYFAKRGDGAALGGRVYNPFALERAARNLELLGYDVYAHLNPSCGNGLKASSRQVTDWQRFLIDLDPISPEIDATVAIWRVLDVAETMIPSIKYSAHVLDSGRGAQAWVEIGSLPHLDKREVERATGEFLRQLRREWDGRYGFRIDSVTYDLARIARLPGTINTKTGRRARFIGAALYRLPSDIILRMFKPPPLEEIARPKNASNLIAVSAHLNGLTREFLHNGVEEGDRHHAANAAARSLFNVGMEYDSVLHWVRRGARKCRPRLSDGDATHCVITAHRKEAND